MSEYIRQDYCPVCRHMKAGLWKPLYIGGGGAALEVCSNCLFIRADPAAYDVHADPGECPQIKRDNRQR